jgi:hypothetical protein
MIGTGLDNGVQRGISVLLVLCLELYERAEHMQDYTLKCKTV